MAEVIAVRYAEALFSVAEEKDLLTRTAKDITCVRTVLAENPDLVNVLAMPDVIPEKKAELLNRIFQEDLEEPMLGLLTVLVRKGRIGQIDEVFAEFEERLIEWEKKCRVTVTSAAALSDAEVSKIRETLAKSMQKEILIDTVIDPSLIGGLVVRVGDVVFDNSIRSSLSKMSRHLRELRISESAQ